LTKQGVGTMTLSGSNTYTGATLIEKGTLRLGSSNRIADASTVTVTTGAVFDMNGHNENVAGLSGGGSVTQGAGRLEVSGSGTNTFSGSVSGSGGLTKSGTGTQGFSGINTFTGGINITGGTLLLGVDNTLAAANSLEIANATFNTGGYSQSLNTLTLTADSTIDFGNLSSVLRFSSGTLSALNGYTLTIMNWTGTIATTGGTDQLIFNNGMQALAGTSSSQIQFVIGSNTYDALFLARPDLGANVIEVVPIPEPGTVGAAVLLLALLAWRERFRLRRWLAAAHAATAGSR
jgi:autotransporter-associated beta strand protein